MNFIRELYKRTNSVLKKRLIYFLDNANISGIRFLSDKYGVPSRIFWGIAIITSFLGMLKIFSLTAKRFYDDDISIGIDTAYLRWNHTFPAVSICLEKGGSTVQLTKYLEDKNISYEKNPITFAKKIQAYLFTNPNSLVEMTAECEGLNSTCGVNFELLKENLLPKSCKQVITDVEYSGQGFENCEQIFKYHETEMGRCFIANSITDYNYDFSKLPLKFTKETDDRSLKFRQIYNPFWKKVIYIHSPEELPFFNTKLDVKMSSTPPTLLYYLLEEIVNSAGVEDIDINRRACRFPNERLPNSTYHYSGFIENFTGERHFLETLFATCMSDLRIKTELQECECTLFTSPKEYKEKYCDVGGMHCLSRADINAKVKELHSSKETACLPSCNEQRLSSIGENEIDGDAVNGMVIIEILNLPTVRYIRQVAKTTLDLVVAIGGVAGLFFGASILNIVEIIHIWFIRKF